MLIVFGNMCMTCGWGRAVETYFASMIYRYFLRGLHYGGTASRERTVSQIKMAQCITHNIYILPNWAIVWACFISVNSCYNEVQLNTVVKNVAYVRFRYIFGPFWEHFRPLTLPSVAMIVYVLDARMLHR